MKRLLKILAAVAVLAAALAAGGGLYLRSAITSAVTGSGAALLGVPVELKSCRVGIPGGEIRITGLAVGNPEGFQSARAFELGDVTVDLSPGSLFSETVRIRRIQVRALAVTVEPGPDGSNLDRLLDQLGRGGRAGPRPPLKETPGRKVAMDKVVIEGGQINAAPAARGGRGLTVPLPAIRISGIGMDTGGATPEEALRTVLSAVRTVVASAAGGSEAAAGGEAEAPAAPDAGRRAAGAAGTVSGGSAAAADAMRQGAAEAAGALRQGAAGALRGQGRAGDR